MKYGEAKKEAGLGLLERNKKSRHERDMRSPDAALGRMLKARIGGRPKQTAVTGPLG